MLIYLYLCSLFSHDVEKGPVSLISAVRLGVSRSRHSHPLPRPPPRPRPRPRPLPRPLPPPSLPLFLLLVLSGRLELLRTSVPPNLVLFEVDFPPPPTTSFSSQVGTSCLASFNCVTRRLAILPFPFLGSSPGTNKDVARPS